MKNAVFWDVVPYRSCVNGRFRGTYRLNLQGRKIRERGTSVSRWLLKMETIRFSETSVRTRSTWRHIPEDGILHRHRCENFRSYAVCNFTPRKYLIPYVSRSPVVRSEIHEVCSRSDSLRVSCTYRTLFTTAGRPSPLRDQQCEVPEA
jgi:hypothetical protein